MGLRHQLDTAIAAVQGLSYFAAERVATGIVFNPLRAELRSDPHPFYRRLRAHDPFHRSYAADGWILSRYADVAAVLADRTFSSDESNQRRYPREKARNARAGIPDPYETKQASMLRLDPPDHTRLRTLVNKAFTPRAVERVRPMVEKYVAEVLARLDGRGGMELVADFAAPLPVSVIAELLGVPVADRERFRHWSDEAVRLLGDKTIEDRRRGTRAMEELGAYLGGVADQRRHDPREDLLTALVRAEDEGARLTRAELVTTCVLLLVAGNETTTKLIGNAVLALLAHPEQLALLRREPERMPGAVEELLRYDGPVQLTSRVVLEDRELAGRPLRRGQNIVLLLAGANRDPEQFAEPERLDVTRKDVRHLGFGHGIHFCVGAQLARLEATLALEAIVVRFPNLRVAGPVVWGSNTVLRGPRSLPLAF
jgi:pimeloyl-[acyl-carrier protein] synthase